MSSPGDFDEKDNFPPADQPASHDLNRALAEAAEGMDFECLSSYPRSTRFTGDLYMLDVINGLANGWVITPVIDAFARRRLFEALAQQPMRVETLVQRYRANEGHLRAALLLLYELGWLDTVDTDFYAANRHTGLVL